MFTDEYQKMLHARSMNNRGALLDSRECGCFFCIKMFTPDKITDWINEETARCPFCTASAFGTKRSRVCGAETEYFDLYDLNFTGCRSCLLCKRKDGERCKCFWKDDLAPIIEKVLPRMHYSLAHRSTWEIRPASFTHSLNACTSAHCPMMIIVITLPAR